MANFKNDGQVLSGDDTDVIMRVLASGTLTIQAATTAYDTDVADINIAAGSLASTDLLVVEGILNNGGNQSIIAKLQVLNVSNGTQDLTADITIADTTITGGFRGIIDQHPNTNDIMRCTAYAIISTGANTGGTTADTNDANVFTTAFTIRINTHQSLSSSAASYLRYKVYVIPT